MKYGKLPEDLGIHNIECNEMMFYQYMPIKMKYATKPIVEKRLECFEDIIGKVCCDFVGEFGLDRFIDSYIYLTAKKMFQFEGNSFNRHGYHTDGFLTDDINYIWSDENPTIFNYSDFKLTMDDVISMKEMESQADDSKVKIYPNKTLLRLNQFNVHKVGDYNALVERTFLKISFSTDKYDLKGNSKNHLINYDWDMNERNERRNIPQSEIK